MSNEEKTEETQDISRRLESVKTLLATMLKAMERLKEATSQRIKVLEVSNKGLVERIVNLEDAFREAFTKAQDNLEIFLTKASGDEDVEEQAALPPSEDEEPSVEVVGK